MTAKSGDQNQNSVNAMRTLLAEVYGREQTELVSVHKQTGRES